MHKRSKNHLSKKLFLLLTVLSFSVAANGQAETPQKCPLKVSEVPFLSRLALGMTADQISKMINVPIKPEPKKTTIYVDRKPSESLGSLGLGTKVKHELFAGETMFRYSSANKNILGVGGVQAIGLEFYKDTLYSFSMLYHSPDLKWKDAGEFAALASEKLNLPKNFWRVGTGVAALTCQNFHFTANVSAENKVLLIFYNPLISEEIQAEGRRLLSEQK